MTNIILKSGTNDHARRRCTEFHNNSHFNARETFQPSKPVTTYNYYGCNIGGPIIKNKTFIFGDYLRDRRPPRRWLHHHRPTAPISAPANFSSQSHDRLRPEHRRPRSPAPDARRSPGNNIPLRPASARSRRSCSRSSRCRIINTNLTNNYAGQTTRSKDQDSFDIKVDHQQSDKDRFSRPLQLPASRRHRSRPLRHLRRRRQRLRRHRRQPHAEHRHQLHAAVLRHVDHGGARRPEPLQQQGARTWTIGTNASRGRRHQGRESRPLDPAV